MKKLLAVLLTMVLVVSGGLIGVSAANDSPEAEGVISGSQAQDATGNKVEIKFEKIDGKVIKDFADELDNLKKETGNNDLKVVDQFKVEINGKPKYPVDIVLDVLGVSKSSKAFILVETADGNIKAIEVTVKKGKLSFTITENIKKLAIVVDKKTAQNVEDENDVKSPQTSDYTTVPFVMVFAALVGAAFVFKAKRT